jgi:hypothetical protein
LKKINILLATAIFGASITLVQGTNQATAAGANVSFSNYEGDESIHTMEIELVDENHDHVWDRGKEYMISGHDGQKVQLSKDYLPRGYEFVTQNPTCFIDKNKEKISFQVKKVGYTLPVKFYDVEKQEYIPNEKLKNVHVDTNNKTRIYADELLNGYEFKNHGEWEDPSYAEFYTSPNEDYLEIRVRKRFPYNVIEFIDKHNKVVDKQKVRVKEQNQIFKLDDTEDYLIDQDNKSLNLNYTDDFRMQVKVSNNRVYKTFEFATKDGITITNFGFERYKVGEKISFEQYKKYLPDGYTIVKGQEFYIVEDDGKTHHIVRVKGKPVSNIINCIDNDSKKIIATVKVDGNIGEYIDTEGINLDKYKLLPIGENYGYYFNDSKKPINLKFGRIINNTISFIDIYSGRIIKTDTVTGYPGKNIKLTAPSGYEFPGNFNDSIMISKTKTSQKVFVTKTESSGSHNVGNGSSSTSSIGSGNANTESKPNKTNPGIGKSEQDYKVVVSTHSITDPVPVFDKTGKQSNRMLSAKSDWAVDKKMVLNGETYFRVSSNEWVKAAHVYEYQSINRVIETQDKISKLYDSKGKLSVSRSLGPNSRWLTDKSTMINGQKYYRVSTNEWLSANDVK